MRERAGKEDGGRVLLVDVVGGGADGDRRAVLVDDEPDAPVQRLDLPVQLGLGLAALTLALSVSSSLALTLAGAPCCAERARQDDRVALDVGELGEDRLRVERRRAAAAQERREVSQRRTRRRRRRLVGVGLEVGLVGLLAAGRAARVACACRSRRRRARDARHLLEALRGAKDLGRALEDAEGPVEREAEDLGDALLGRLGLLVLLGRALLALARRGPGPGRTRARARARRRAVVVLDAVVLAVALAAGLPRLGVAAVAAAGADAGVRADGDVVAEAGVGRGVEAARAQDAGRVEAAVAAAVDALARAEDVRAGLAPARGPVLVVEVGRGRARVGAGVLLGGGEGPVVRDGGGLGVGRGGREEEVVGGRVRVEGVRVEGELEAGLGARVREGVARGGGERVDESGEGRGRVKGECGARVRVGRVDAAHGGWCECCLPVQEVGRGRGRGWMTRGEGRRRGSAGERCVDPEGSGAHLAGSAERVQGTAGCAR